MVWRWSVLACLATMALGQNIYPDPGFEQSGREGVAHSGARAGYLSVGGKAHFVTLGGRLSVEPFATYRASAWAKAKQSEGACLGLYVYQWDSYVWAFGTNVPLANGGDWQKIEIIFRSPVDHTFLHPLAFLDAANGEAWIDDVVVERIATPAETVAELKAKTGRSADETRLLGRWYVQAGDLAAAKALIRPDGDALANADVACVVAKASGSQAERAAMLAAMVRYGAPRYNDGNKRISEVAATLHMESAVDDLRAAMLTPPTTDGWRQYAQCLTALLAYRPAGPQPLGSRRALVDRLSAASQGASAVFAGQVVPAEVVRLAETAATERARLENDMKQLGKATVVLGGKAITPETHVIVTPEKPTPSEQTAARDLQMHLERITGRLIGIVAGEPKAGLACLVVGNHPLIKQWGVSIDRAKLGIEGIRIKSVGPNLVLYGGQRGVLYAVYTFLEDNLGCRWFTFDCATWPKTGRIAVPALDVTFVPALEYRATDYPCSRPPEFAVRNRLNGMQVEADETWGDHITYAGFVHTFNSLVSPDQYFAAHPEYFSEIGGKRTRDYSQLCLTNPDVLRIATETVRRWIAENPRATIVSVSQNDWHNPCACAKCAALAEAEGAQSGPLLHFVNAIANDIAKDHPNIIIDTLAYQYTRKPPKTVRPAPNVAVRLCSIECEFNRPIESSPYNKTFVDDIHGWNKICSRLHIWDYVINYAHSIMPFPNLNVLAPNINFFINNGVTGLYEEADYYTKGGEMSELRTYLMAKLLWKPDFDVKRGIREFTDAYFGPAAPSIRAYLDDIHRLAVSDPNYHMPIYVAPRSPFQTPEAVARQEQQFAAAEAAVAGDPVRLHRVQVAKLPVLYTQIAQHTGTAYTLSEKSLDPVKGTSVADIAAEFGAIAHAEGVTRVSEGGTDLDTWLRQVGPGAQSQPVVRLRNAALEAIIVPGLGGRLLSLKAAGGRELMQVVRDGGGINPLVGGYKEFSQSGYQSPGWSEAYAVLDQSATGVTLTATVGKGLKLERRYELDAARMCLRIRTTATNTAKEAQTACLRAHTCLALDDAAKAAALIGRTRHSLAEGAKAEKELWLRDKDKPAGEWKVLGILPGLDLVSRFQPEQVSVCYLNWNGPDHRLNPELWSNEVSLKPGESLTMAHELEWVPAGK
ncbi:MAG: DUF4838 domain-containing protein [Armatimonadetes bacterium]|nr:DUF4838 domain-containing protein [Armatimonadota bacterium]